MTTFNLGDWVLISSQKGKKWLVRIQDGPYSCHLGTIQLQDIVGMEEGDYLETNTGAKLFFLRPTLVDYIFHMKRQTQIIYPKDLGAILVYGDIQPGDTVLESGIGSGAMTLALLRAVGEKGRVVSVEKNPRFAFLAHENIRKFFGHPPVNHLTVVADVQAAGIAVKVDRIVLDLPEPWHAIRHVAPLLKRGGLIISLSPNVGQVQLTHRELKHNGFIGATTFELLRREWKVDELRARPQDRMVAHTGFITIAKKAADPVTSQPCFP